MLPLAGAAISAGANIYAGSQTQKAQERANAENLQFAREQAKLQDEYARHGIRIRAADARKAGIHPLYALGAPTIGGSAVSIGQIPATGMAQGLANAGQDIGRALNATRTTAEREDAFTSAVKNLQVQNMGLQNELLASQIAKLRAGANPPMPSSLDFPGPVMTEEESKRDPNKLMVAGGTQIQGDPTTSPMKTFEDQWGDDGPVSWIMQAYKVYRDYLNTVGGAAHRASANEFHVPSRSPARRWWVNEMQRRYEGR